MCPHEIKGKRQRNEIDNLIVLFCYKLIKKSQMMDNPFQFRVLLKSHTRSKHLESLEGTVVYYYGTLPRILLKGITLKNIQTAKQNRKQSQTAKVI